MKKILMLSITLILLGSNLQAQPEFRIVSGQQDTVRAARHFFRGMTVPGSQLSVNDVSFPVYHTGAFAAEVNLTEGPNKVNFVVRHGGQETVKELDIYYMPRRTPQNERSSTGREVAKNSLVFYSSEPLYVRSKGEFPYLNYGLGQDRLGGSKIGYISPGIDMKVIDKVDNLYRVQLSKYHSAWIPESEVESPVVRKLSNPDALTSSWSVYGDNHYDYVKISLSDKLPYRNFQEINPARIVVDIYGVATNTSWITQLLTTKNITNVNYEQIEDDVLRIFIDLNTKQHWGYSVYYEGNQLVIRVKHQPNLRLKGLRIALDAGHGGPADGAVGTTGLKEKEVNLELVMMLKAELEKKGARVVLTRSDDSDLSMLQRLSILKQQMPDLLVSIHNNAGGSPLTAKGTSTYYRHIGYRPLSTAILSKLLELDVENFGNIGSFNFALNSPTEYPNVLVEGLFMSTPADEAKLTDKNFKVKFVKKIVDGLEDFLKNAD